MQSKRTLRANAQADQSWEAAKDYVACLDDELTDSIQRKLNRFKNGPLCGLLDALTRQELGVLVNLGGLAWCCLAWEMTAESEDEA